MSFRADVVKAVAACPDGATVHDIAEILGKPVRTITPNVSKTRDGGDIVLITTRPHYAARSGDVGRRIRINVYGLPEID